MKITRLFFILGTCFLLGCNYVASKKPNIIIISVENLGVNEILCGGESFESLCESSVRFTHAYSPSNLSPASLTSVLTGLEPEEHKVRHARGFAAAKIQFVSEAALEQGYSTQLISGGPPILRRLGIHQGFEYFDDYVNLNSTPFRSFEESQSLFWQQLEFKRSTPLFSVFYISDLLFTHRATQNELGDLRDLSYKSQLEELDEQLSIFIKKLKQEKLWDNTYIFFVGLNGPGWIERSDLRKNLNILSGRTQVAMLVKAPHKPRDLGLQWTIDNNVSLTDIGNTIWEILGQKRPEKISLLTAITHPKVDWSEDRILQSESAWALFNHIGPVLYGVRQKSLFYLHVEPPRLYNSLTDRLELNPLPQIEAESDLFSQASKESLLEQKKLPFMMESELLSSKWARIDKWFTGPKLLFNESLEVELREELENTKDTDYFSVLALLYIQKKRWDDLKEIAKIFNNKDVLHLSHLHLGTKTKTKNPCLAWLDTPSAKLSRSCEDSLVTDFYKWQKESDPQKSEVLRARFIRSYTELQQDRYLSRLNLSFGILWESPWQKTLSLKPLDLVLAHPTYKDLKIH